MEEIRRNEVLMFEFEEKIPFLQRVKEQKFLPQKMRDTIDKFLEMIDHKHELATSRLENLKFGILALESKMKNTIDPTKRTYMNVQVKKELNESSVLPSVEPRKGPILKSNFDKSQLEPTHTYVARLTPKQEKCSVNKKPEKWYYGDDERSTQRSYEKPHQKFSNEKRKPNATDMKTFLNLTIDTDVDEDIRKIANTGNSINKNEFSTNVSQKQDYRQKFIHLIKKKEPQSNHNDANNELLDCSRITTPYPSSQNSKHVAESNILATEHFYVKPSSSKEKRMDDNSKEYSTTVSNNIIRHFMLAEKEPTYKNPVADKESVSDPRKNRNMNNNDEAIEKKGIALLEAKRTITRNGESLKVNSEENSKSQTCKEKTKTPSYSKRYDNIRTKLKLSSNINATKEPMKANSAVESKENGSKNKTVSYEVGSDKKSPFTLSHTAKSTGGMKSSIKDKDDDLNVEDESQIQNHNGKIKSQKIDQYYSTNTIRLLTMTNNITKNNIKQVAIDGNDNNDKRIMCGNISIDDTHPENLVQNTTPCESTDKNASQSSLTTSVSNSIGQLKELVVQTKENETTFDVHLELSAFQQHRYEKQFKSKQRANKRGKAKGAVTKGRTVTKKMNSSENLIKIEPETPEPIKVASEKENNKPAIRQRISVDEFQTSIESSKEHSGPYLNIIDTVDQCYEVVNVPVKLENEEISNILQGEDISSDIEPLKLSDNMEIISHIDIIKTETDCYDFGSSTFPREAENIEANILNIKSEPIEQNNFDDNFTVSDMSDMYEFKVESLPMIKEELIEMEEQDFLSYQHKVSNLGYIDSPISFLFLCKVLDCSYYNGDRKIFLEHLNEYHIGTIWDGFCYKCESSITADDTTLHEEYKHLLRVHVNNNDFTEVVDCETDENIAYMPALKIRRIDDLLTNERTNNVDTTHMFNTGNIVKPWTSIQNQKQENILKTMLEPKNISKHFKCMGNTCKYSCSNSDNFFSHLNKHGTIGDSKEYLNCCYCSFTSENVLELKLHIEEHKRCNFQCRYCFFRGVRQVYVTRHQDIFHKDQPKSVIKCGNEETFEVDYLMGQLNMNISPYKCPNCVFKTYVYASIEQHLPTHLCEHIKCSECDIIVDVNDYLKHTKEHNFSKWQCLFCKVSFSGNERILDHLIINHNGAVPPFYCKRESSKVSKANESTGEVIELPLIVELSIRKE